MPDNAGAPELENRDYFKEAVCIDAARIYDSCSDKDCVDDIRVLFPTAQQALVDSATNVRIRDVSVITVYLDLQPIPFNKGFYSVDMTFFFDVALDLFGGPSAAPIPVNGVSIFNKKVILYGSEGNVKMFSSDKPTETDAQDSRVLPKATVQNVEYKLRVKHTAAKNTSHVWQTEIVCLLKKYSRCIPCGYRTGCILGVNEAEFKKVQTGTGRVRR